MVQIPDESLWPDCKSVSDTQQVQEADVCLPAFDLSYVAPVEASAMSQFLLRDGQSQALSTHGLSEPGKRTLHASDVRV